MKESLYGPCGLYCGACGATDCDGCLSSRIDETITGCKFLQCTKEKELEFCCFCREYPCKKLDRFMNDQWPHHQTIKANLEEIRKHGKDAWLATQKKKWSCPDCGSAIYWYLKSCSCGRQLDAWDAPGRLWYMSPDEGS